MRKRGNGEGTIYYSEKLKRWVGQFTAGVKPNGKINRKTVYGKTRKEVSEKIIKKQNEVNNETFIDKDDITLKEIIESFIQEQFKANTIAEVTYLRKQETAKIIYNMNISNMPIQKIKISDINNSLSQITYYADSVISKAYELLSATFNKAVLLNKLQKNPFIVKGAIIKPKSTKQSKTVDALTIEEQKAFIEELNSKNYLYKDIFIIALYTGMRIGEILALSKENIDLDNNLIYIKKSLTKDTTGKVKLGTKTKTYSGTREIPITEFIRDILINNKNKDLLFLENEKLIAPATINSHFKRIAKNAGIRVVNTKKNKSNADTVNLKISNVNTHMLRHTYATRCIEAGMSAVVLQRLLGHKNIQITLNTYTSIFNKFKEEEITKVTKYLNTI